ncbi:hypothetical protein FIS3754_10840 [Fischerella sp. NIES-3754]|nr:hypothetical protein FIS3754_10840 [Fischerella sp. NIES-3754]BCX07443.1 MAG: hypothetical protein KatS3mg066_1302 [Fischerella sp.]
MESQNEYIAKVLSNRVLFFPLRTQDYQFYVNLLVVARWLLTDSKHQTTNTKQQN